MGSLQDLETNQSLQSDIWHHSLTDCFSPGGVHTLHLRSSVNRIFLAARSLCTNPLYVRYFMPQAMSLLQSRRKVGVGGGLSPGLQDEWKNSCDLHFNVHSVD